MGGGLVSTASFMHLQCIVQRQSTSYLSLYQELLLSGILHRVYNWASVSFLSNFFFSEFDKYLI